MRKIFAFLSSALTIYIVKRMFDLFTSTDIDIIKQRPILVFIGISFVVPLLILSIWLWRPKRKN